MRVVGGTFRGLKLFPPQNQDIRPTTDRIKEDMFNIISSYLYDALFLDLFSGSGAIAIEAISRGASRAYAIDNNKQSIELIHKNIAKTKTPEKFKVVRTDVEQFLLSTSNKYDIIFLDPPYRYKNTEKLLKTIIDIDILNQNGILIVEQSSPIPVPPQFDIIKVKRYSATSMQFAKLRDPSLKEKQ